MGKDIGLLRFPITHSPYTEGRCSWSRINDADYNASAVAILAHPDLPTFLITNRYYAPHTERYATFYQNDKCGFQIQAQPRMPCLCMI